MGNVLAHRQYGDGVVMGSEDIMAPKAHGTTERPVQDQLKWNVDQELADRICCYNRHYAEHSGYFRQIPDFLAEVEKSSGPVTFYDSVSGKPLFVAPKGRSKEEFLAESRSHGWPSFRDQEVVWENVRVLPNGETVSVDGTHLGHDLPDGRNRYCINLVCIAGKPVEAASSSKQAL